MQRPTIAILGASGYTGIELTRLVALHPGVELTVAGSDRWAGEAVAVRAGVATGVRYTTPDRAVELALGCSAVLLATPAEVSHELVPRLVGSGFGGVGLLGSGLGGSGHRRIVIDLSGAFRLRDAAAYPRHYGFTHHHPGLLAEAVYSVPELARARLAGAKLIANPGCYATAIQLALAPLLPALVTGPIVVDAVYHELRRGRR